MNAPTLTRLILAFLWVLAGGWSLNAQAQCLDEEDPIDGDPHCGVETWLQPSPAVQLEQDPALRPAASGGIFVPALTRSTSEPFYQVLQEGKLLDEKRTGRVSYVSPGVYTVLVGSGVPENKLEFEVNVVEGLVTFVPVEWGGLLINVVDERGTPFRGSYELVRMPSREYVGIGLGAELAQGEQLDTWLLWPGTYMILASGESYQARKNFTTLRLPPGQLIQYTIVLDTDTGDLMGAGEVAVETENREGWDLNLVLGGSVLFNQADKVIGKAEGQTLDVSAFIETIGGYLDPDHFVYARLNTEIGGSLRLADANGSTDQPFVTTVDAINLDLLYAYRFLPWFGPYARTSLETTMLPSYQVFDEPTAIERYDSNGGFISGATDVLDVKLSEPFAPIDLEGGAGGRLDLSFGYWFNLDTRLGVGLRQVFARDLYVVDSSSSDLVQIKQIEDANQIGAEAALILELSPTRWLLVKTDANLLAPFDDFSNPFLDFRGTITLRLSSIASLNYTIRVKDDPEILDETQVDQSLLLRFAYKVL